MGPARRALAGGLLVAAVAPAVDGGEALPALEEVLARHLAARGGTAAIEAVATARIRGVMSLGPDLHGPFLIELKKPDRLRFELSPRSLRIVQVIDGRRGWTVMPATGPDPVPMTADQLAAMRRLADLLEGPLVHHRAKGHGLELLGRETLAGASAYVLRLTHRHGEVVRVFVDAGSFLEIRHEGMRSSDGGEVAYETAIGDYRSVGPLRLPHAYRHTVHGATQPRTLIVESFEVNVPIDDSRFIRP